MFLDGRFDEKSGMLDGGGLQLDSQHVVGLLGLVVRKKESLRHLLLARNQLTPEDVGRLMQTLTVHGIELESLDLSDNMVGGSVVEAVGKYAQNTPRLQTLSLWNTHLGSRGLRLLAGYVRQHPSLQTLNVAGNNAEEAAVVDMLVTVRFSCVNLKQLVLVSGNQCGEVYGQVAMVLNKAPL